jgi:hypothetical protein
MRAVWSLWTLPCRLRRGWNWHSERHHLLSWILSVETARPHFDETALYTDDHGAAWLVDGLGLQFTKVSTALNELDSQDPDWWMLGKLHTYRLQQKPFVHLDGDVYLWKPLPPRLLSAAVMAQNPEDVRNFPWYDLDFCQSIIRDRGEGTIPIEWRRYRTTGSLQQAACCGILGGNNIGFLQRYASTAIQILENPRNRSAFATLPDKKVYNPLFEQYLLCACAAFNAVHIEYLFDSLGSAGAQATETGYTHLLSGAKSVPRIAGRLEQRIARDFPAYYKRCKDMTVGQETAAGATNCLDGRQ